VAAGCRSLFDSCQGAGISHLVIAFSGSPQSVQRPEGSSINNVTLEGGVETFVTQGGGVVCSKYPDVTKVSIVKYDSVQAG